ncbi:hypothetical protein AB0A05_07650 [Streptomyces sp. NPDC046374]|uniref:hypothetical protein n=1 Tax=Streptomyces sp. NPDC046374 TaxID=3154917 RepID=UPI00340E548A
MPPRRRRPARELPPSGLLDWTASRHWSAKALPCRYCGNATHLRDSKRNPADKVCAEKALRQEIADAAEAYADQWRPVTLTAAEPGRDTQLDEGNPSP